MIRVLLEQRLISPYRVPFFARLAERVDLLVLASQDMAIPGATDVVDNLPFRAVRSHELCSQGRYPYHEDIVAALAQHRAEVYVSNDMYLTTFAADRALRADLRRTGVKVIWWGCDGYWCHDFVKARRQQSLWFRLTHRACWLSLVQPSHERAAMRIADGFIAYSSHTAAYWRRVCGIPLTRITVAHNALDVDVLLQRGEALAREGVRRQPGRIVFVGRMVEGKQIDLLLRAYGRVKRIYDEASLMLIGDGPLRPVLEEQARRLRLDDIAFLGYIEDQIGLADLLYTASLYVLPGLGGLGINTAMACGLPVICSRGDGTERDLVQEGLNGWFFAWNSEEDLARVILQAISAPEQLARAGTESLRLIQERYNLDRMVDAFLDRVERTLEGRGRR